MSRVLRAAATVIGLLLVGQILLVWAMALYEQSHKRHRDELDSGALDPLLDWRRQWRSRAFWRVAVTLLALMGALALWVS